MAYEPKAWECGDVITAEDLNHLEQGVANAGGGSAPLVVNVEWTTDEHNNDVGTLDKTWQEIFDAYPNAYLMDDGIKYIIITVGSEGGQYGVESRVDMFTANDPNGYPTLESGEDVLNA